MKQPISITCPVSQQKVNEQVVRIVALLVAALTILALISGNYLITGFLTIDFSLRAFSNGNGSLLKLVGKQLHEFSGKAAKPVNAAPKKFAASLGVIFSALITVLLLSQLQVAAIVVGGLLIACALLEGLAGFCVGCVIYSFLQLLLKK